MDVVDAVGGHVGVSVNLQPQDTKKRERRMKRRHVSDINERSSRAPDNDITIRERRKAEAKKKKKEKKKRHQTKQIAACLAQTDSVDNAICMGDSCGTRHFNSI